MFYLLPIANCRTKDLLQDSSSSYRVSAGGDGGVGGPSGNGGDGGVGGKGARWLANSRRFLPTFLERVW